VRSLIAEIFLDRAAFGKQGKCALDWRIIKSPGWVVFCFALSWLALPLWGQEAVRDSDGSHANLVGVPTDWSHEHLIFSAPLANSETERNLEREPRYWLQIFRRWAFEDANASQPHNSTSESYREQYEFWEHKWKIGAPTALAVGKTGGKEGATETKKIG
jgi:hypothetical protein